MTHVLREFIFVKKIRAALTASVLMLLPSFGQAIEGGTQT